MADPIRSIEDLMIDDILEREGSTFTDDPVDRGGATKFGVTQKSWMFFLAQTSDHDKLLRVLPDHVRDITELHARFFYSVMFYRPLAWIDDIELRELVLDSSVNHGAARATKWLQRAAGCAEIDGVIGPETRKLVNSFGHAPGVNPLYALILIARLKFYVEIVLSDPSQVRFLRGWMNRITEFIR